MTSSEAVGFLTPPADDSAGAAMREGDLASIGFVMNLTHVWAQLPDAHRQIMATQATAAEAAGLTMRQRGILVLATASTIGDSYCSLAWSHKLHVADVAAVDELAGLLHGDDSAFDGRERALARWARLVAGHAGSTAAQDLAPLRDAGFDDRQIFAITLFVGLRIAFSTVNAALGVQPDAELGDVPEPVRSAVTYGRTIAGCI